MCGANVAKPLAHMRSPANPTLYGPGATRSCFALLGAFPARRDEALRGALVVWVWARAGRVARLCFLRVQPRSLLCCATRRCFDPAVSDAALCGRAVLMRLLPFVLKVNAIG